MKAVFVCLGNYNIKPFKTYHTLLLIIEPY